MKDITELMKSRERDASFERFKLRLYEVNNGPKSVKEMWDQFNAVENPVTRGVLRHCMKERLRKLPQAFFYLSNLSIE